MPKTKIPVEKVDDHASFPPLIAHSTRAAMGALLFLLGAWTGGVHLPEVNPTQQLGAIGASTKTPSELQGELRVPEMNQTPNTETLVEEESMSTVVSVSSEITDEATIQSLALEKKLRMEKINALNLSIDDYEQALDRLNAEIEQIKNDSLTLIAEFNQNCGNWSDECATSYVARLEARNTRYGDLAQKQSALTRELSVFYQELRDLLTE